MEKTELFKRIKDSYIEDEWDRLESGEQEVPVNESNRKLLLALRETRTRFKGSIDDADVEKLTAEVKAFLDETWAEEPLAHKYVIDSCLAQTFLLEKPMHPWDSVRYFSVVNDGVAEYYCPHKTDSIICGFCRSKFCDELYSSWDKKVEETRAAFGDTSADIQRMIFESGFMNSGMIDTKDIVYHDEVRAECAKNRCGAYGKTWACPPAVGTVAECKERVSAYSRMQLFSKAYVMLDTMDMAETLDNMANFKKCSRELDKKLKERKMSFILLSNESCDRCKKCTYPDKPCRFPDELHHSLESYGYNVLELSRQAGLKYINGQKTVTFFGAVIYDE